MAGGMLQCPKCGKLNDAPTLSDLANMEGDGTFKLDAPPVEPEKNRLSKLIRTFAHITHDDDGNEIDLRNDVVQMGKAGVNEVAPQYRAKERHNVPKYDPVTGELVLPMEVAEQAATPMMAVPVGEAANARILGYARPNPRNAGGRLGEEPPADPLVTLLRPLNVFVMSIVFLWHFVAASAMVFGVVIGPLLIVFGPILVVILLMIPGHYGCVVEEFGPEGRNELPRPLRSVEFWDDIFYPAMRFIVAGVCAYAPAVAVAWTGSIPEGVRALMALVLAIGGSIIFPVLLLTTVAGGAYVNLRPDRVLATLWACGMRYWAAVAYWVVGLAMYSIVLFGTIPPVLALLFPAPPGWLIGSKGIWVAAMGLAVVFTHALCMELGLLYRKHHSEFPWAFQRHVPTNAFHRNAPGQRAGLRATTAQGRAAAKQASRHPGGGKGTI